MNKKSSNSSKGTTTRAVEIERLEVQLQSKPNEFTQIVQLADLYLLDNREAKGVPLLKKAVKMFKDSSLPATQGVALADVLMQHWKMDRFVNKGTMRVNVSDGRRERLRTLMDVTSSIHKLNDPQLQQSISLRLAFLKECSGSLQDALTMLSDLISAQASNGVDLSYIIFKAAILLKHMGENSQAIEYLEYLQDDPPVENGFSKMHVLAFLILLYEQSGEKYRVFLPKTYRDLSISLDTDPDVNKSKQSRRMLEIVKSKSVQFTSDLWELLAFQALDKCEYVLAAELLHQASLKSPNKGLLLHCLVEVLFLLGEKEAAGKLGDKAMVLLPSSAELRNLMLLIDPDKWGDKLRFIGPTSTPIEREESFVKPVKIKPIDYSDVPDAVQVDANTKQPPPPSENLPPQPKSSSKPKAKKEEPKGLIASTTAAHDAEVGVPPTHHESTKSEGGLFSKLKSSAISAFLSPRAVAPSSSNANKPTDDAEKPPSPVKSALGQTVRPHSKIPQISPDARNVLNKALKGKTNVHYYDETLMTLASIRKITLQEKSK